MKKHFYFLLFICLLSSGLIAQSITVSDSINFLNEVSPYPPVRDYSYGQTIYLQSEIQGSGWINALTYHYDGNSLSNSDSLWIFMGSTEKQYFENDGKMIPLAKLDSVYRGRIAINTTLPGLVTITLNKPFYYSGDSNLVIAMNEMRPGNQFVSSSGIYSYTGYNKRIRNFSRTFFYYDLNPMNPYYVEQQPPFTYFAESGGVANVTLHGLTPFPCQSPKKVRFTNINHDNARVLWTPPGNATAATRYEVYYSTNQTDPTAATPATVQNISDTQTVLTNLQPTTTYKVWTRSNCGTSKSVWTLVDSFTTLCSPQPIPTAAEQFNTWLPNCWVNATGKLGSAINVNYLNVANSSAVSWRTRQWRNVTGGGNPAAVGFFTGTGVDSTFSWLISPPMNLGTSGNKSLEFDIALTRNNNQQQATLDADDKLMVVVSTDNGTTWSSSNILQQWASPQTISASGQHVIMPLAGYNGVVRVGFYIQSVVFTSITNLFIDNVQITGVMPVKWISFTGTREGSSNLLQWRTGSEQNNRGFEVQTATSSQPLSNGEGQEGAFRTIAFVPTQANGGNSSNALLYTYTDKKPLPGGNYYRLRQVDNDGRYSYSNVVVIKGNEATTLQLMAIYPNPARGSVRALIQSPTAQQVQLTITDLAGKTIQQQTLWLQKGSNTPSVNIASLSRGTYLLKLVCDNRCNAGVMKLVVEGR